MAAPFRGRRAVTAFYGGLAALAVALVLARLGPARAPWTQDETDLVAAAVAMADDSRFFVRPTYHPELADAGRTLGAGLVAPPLAPWLIALPSQLGLRSSALWPLVPGAVFLAGLVAFVRQIAKLGWARALIAALVLLALSPRLIVDVLTLEAEIPLAGLVLGALAWSWRPAERPSWHALVAGVLLGLGFLCKLWLVVPAALAVLGCWSPRPRAALLLVIAASTTGASHLAFVAVVDSGSLGRWLREVYLAVLGLEGVAMTKWAGVAAHPEWSHGPAYYPLAIARELGFALPFVLVGAYRLARPSTRFLASSQGRAWVGFCLGLALLSVPRIKEPLYVLPLVAACLGLGAHGLWAVDRACRSWLLRLTIAATALVVCGLTPRPANAPDDGRLARLLGAPTRRAGPPSIKP